MLRPRPMGGSDLWMWQIINVICSIFLLGFSKWFVSLRALGSTRTLRSPCPSQKSHAMGRQPDALLVGHRIRRGLAHRSPVP